MGTTERQCTNLFLSFVILLLGTGITVLLYYAGQKTIDLFWGDDATYKDKLGRINHRDVTDKWYGKLVLRGWAFGLQYVVPGISGIVAALFYNKPTMIVHLFIAIIVLFFGSFLHSAGGAAILLYRLLVVEGASRYDPLLGDCIYVRDNDLNPDTNEDHKCMVGRKALLMAVAAVCMLCLAWIFVLAHVLYCAFTFSSVSNPRNKNAFTFKYTRLTESANDQSTAGTSPGQTAATNRPRQRQRQRWSPLRWRLCRSRKEVRLPVAPEVSITGATASVSQQPSTSAEGEKTENTPMVASDLTSGTNDQPASPGNVEMSLCGTDDWPSGADTATILVTDLSGAIDQSACPETVEMCLSGTGGPGGFDVCHVAPPAETPRDVEVSFTNRAHNSTWRNVLF